MKRRFRQVLGTLHTAHGSAHVKHPVIARALQEQRDEIDGLRQALGAAYRRISELEAPDVQNSEQAAHQLVSSDLARGGPGETQAARVDEPAAARE